jgi:non-ribosomal peptide synthetase component F
MFDLGRTLLAVVERSPDALAIVDGERRLSYAAWYGEIGRVAGGLAALGLGRRDRLTVILQNRLEMASRHRRQQPRTCWLNCKRLERKSPILAIKRFRPR